MNSPQGVLTISMWRLDNESLFKIAQISIIALRTPQWNWLTTFRPLSLRGASILPRRKSKRRHEIIKRNAGSNSFLVSVSIVKQLAAEYTEISPDFWENRVKNSLIPIFRLEKVIRCVELRVFLAASEPGCHTCLVTLRISASKWKSAAFLLRMLSYSRLDRAPQLSRPATQAVLSLRPQSS